MPAGVADSWLTVCRASVLAAGVSSASATFDLVQIQSKCAEMRQGVLQRHVKVALPSADRLAVVPLTSSTRCNCASGAVRAPVDCTRSCRWCRADQRPE